tara:strand:+ start:193 stop:1416 length:1224 start_codon:yes stop_codon:yes gene_type:complete
MMSPLSSSLSSSFSNRSSVLSSKTGKRFPKSFSRRMMMTTTNASYDDDANANGGDEYYRDVELNVHLLSPNNHHHRQRYYDDEYNTKNNYRGGVIIQEHTNTVCVPVYAKPPLAFLLGMFCAMPIALWEAKRKVRLDSRIYGGLDSSSSLSSSPTGSEGEASRGPQPPKATTPSSASSAPTGPGKRALKASTVAALARVNAEMYLPTPKERSYGHQASSSNVASGEGMSMERKGGRESKVTFSRMVDGARSMIASAATSTIDMAVSTLPTVVIEEDVSGDDDLDIMRLRKTNDSTSSSSSTSRTLIAARWSPPEHDPSATILVGGNIEQLGGWTPENCVHMKSIGGNKWIADIGHITAATEVEFKFVVESKTFGRRAETGEVRKFNVPVLRAGETKYTHVARQAPRW